MAADRRSGHLTGALLLAAGAVLAASALPGVPALVESIGFALVGAAAGAFADAALRHRRLGPLVVSLVLLAVGDRLAEHAVAEGRTWAVPAALGAYLLWSAATGTTRAVLLRTVPAAVAVTAPLALRASARDAAVMAGLLVPAAVLAVLAALLRARSLAAAAGREHDQTDVDAVVMANLELRNVGDATECAQRIARMATDLLDAAGAVVWLQGPGRLLCAGGHGITPSPSDRELAEGSAVDRVLQTGSVVIDADEVIVPLTGSGGVFGAVTIARPGRAVPTFVTSILQVLGAQAGYSLERLRAVEGMIDARFVDPVTGVGNRMAATASLATLRPGDAVLLVAVDGLARIRLEEGDARADLVLGQLGLHIRNATRAGDLVARFGDDVFFLLLRDLNSSAEDVVTRLLESWQQAGTTGSLRAGAALHFAGGTPLDALDRAAEALTADVDGRDPIGAAAERAAWGPSAT